MLFITSDLSDMCQVRQIRTLLFSIRLDRTDATNQSEIISITILPLAQYHVLGNKMFGRPADGKSNTEPNKKNYNMNNHVIMGDFKNIRKQMYKLYIE